MRISQGLMYGYATDETPELMPLTIVLAHKLNKQMADYRRDGTLPWMRPDSKSQVRVEMQCSNGHNQYSLYVLVYAVKPL